MVPQLTMNDVQLGCISMLHALHFALQKAVRHVLDEPGSRVIDSKMIDILMDVLAASSLLSSGGDVLENYVTLLKRSGLVGDVSLEKASDDRYLLKFENCIFASNVHPLLKPKDVTCLWAYVAMSLYMKATGQKPELVDSYFTDTGSKTELTPRRQAP